MPKKIKPPHRRYTKKFPTKLIFSDHGMDEFMPKENKEENKQ